MALTRPILRYHGGKWRLAEWIISHLPVHKTYVEPFSGAASVLLRKPKSKVEVLNDRYERLVNVFRVLRDPIQSERLQCALRYTACSEVEFRAARQQHADPVEDARRMIVLGHQGHGSTGASGGRLTGWRRGIRPSGPPSAAEWESLYHLVPQWADRLRGVFLECADAASVIRRWDGSDTVFYVDPPYIASTRASGLRGYAHEMTDNDHRALAAVLNAVKGIVVISGYSSDLYDEELYVGWQRFEFCSMADKSKRTTEVLWVSPNVVEITPSLFSVARP